jgi:hypothetical protein
VDARLIEVRAVGFVGAVVVALTALRVGATPVGGIVEMQAGLHGLPPVELALAYFGLALLVGAWLRLGSVVRDHRVAPRAMLTTLAWWAVPLAVSAPLYSRDVYSYLAQGALFVRGLDVYEFGPAALGGPLTAQVSLIWQHTPAPYGPSFLLAAGAVMAVAGESVLLGVVGMRVLALASLVAVAWAVPVIARRHGVDPSRALWLGVLNPLVLAHVVAGVHNEALMVALLLAAVVLALRGRPLLAAAVVGVACLVKAPAVVALAFIVAAAWGPRPLRALPLLSLATRVGGVAAATVVALTLATGTGVGWAAALGNTAEQRNGLSMSTNLGMALDAVLALLGLAGPVDVVAVTRALGLAAVVALAGWLLLRRRDRPFQGLALVLLAVVVLGPVVHPWYLLWGSVLLAATTSHPTVVRWVALLSAGLAFYPMPSGGGPTIEALWGLAGIAAAVLFLPLSRPLSAPLADQLADQLAGLRRSRGEPAPSASLRG